MGYRKSVNDSTACNLIAACALVLSSLTTIAQTKPLNKPTPAQQKAMVELEWMQQALVLSPEQYDQVNAINENYTHKCDSMDHIKDLNAKVAATAKCSKSKDEELKLVLNTKQYKQYIDHKGKKYKPARSPFGNNY